MTAQAPHSTASRRFWLPLAIPLLQVLKLLERMGKPERLEEVQSLVNKTTKFLRQITSAGICC